MNRIWSALIVGIMLIAGCKGVKEEQASSQMQEVMALHDEVMPKMRTISKLVGELKPKVDTTAMGLEYAAAMKDLQDAHVSMMDWMQGFGDRFNFDEIHNGKELSPEKASWLDEEEQKMKLVRDNINSSIEKANRLLGHD